MVEMITRTLSRFILSVSSWIRGEWIAKLASGLSAEPARIAEMRDKALCAAVPSASLCSDAIYDMEEKYGIAHDDSLSDTQRVTAIVQRASRDGAGGPEWLQIQVQAAGFPLYVIENTERLAQTTMFGDVQFDETTQFATMPKRIDPSTVSGVLITSSANRRGGARVASSSQFGSGQFGSSQFGTPDSSKSYPQPAGRSLPTDPTLWGRVFFLSPFEDRLASSDELLILSDEQISALRKLIEQIKFLRNWCIAQVGTDIERVTDDGATRVLEDGTTIRRI
jgi:hypothetical protein